MEQKTVVLIVGTRPEALKLWPLYQAFKQSLVWRPLLCVTGQHQELLSTTLKHLGWQPDIDFSCDANLSQPGRSLNLLMATLLERFAVLWASEPRPNLVVVQGDTCSALAGALTAFYAQIPIVHIEAGLRTYDLQAPFPEEANRQLITRLAQWHFAPTQADLDNLLNEGVASQKGFVVGNTIVDTLLWAQKRLVQGQVKIPDLLAALVAQVLQQRLKLIILTFHRRENIVHIQALQELLVKLCAQHKELMVVYLQHPNPAFNDLAAGLQARLSKERFLALKPLLYMELIYLLQHSCAIFSDSGGLLEEAISLGKHVVCLRNKTERWQQALCRQLTLLELTDCCEMDWSSILDNMVLNRDIGLVNNFFGNGFASEKIVHILTGLLN